VLVLQFEPLIVYSLQRRVLFSDEEYNLDSTAKTSHLTNTPFATLNNRCGWEHFSRLEGVSEEKIDTVTRKMNEAILYVFKSLDHFVTVPIDNRFMDIFGFDFMLDEEWNVYLLEVNILPDERGGKVKRNGKMIDIKLETEKLHVDSTPISDNKWKLFHNKNNVHKTEQNCYTEQGTLREESDMYMIANEALKHPFYKTSVRSSFCTFYEPPPVKEEL